MSGNRPIGREIGLALVALLAVACASVFGATGDLADPAAWYAGLVRPSFSAPNWLFAPVWTTLCLLMAFALWRVLRLPAQTPGRRTALTLFFTQLALNAAWSWMFFAAHSPLLGLANILPQLGVILATIAAFWQLARAAGSRPIPLAAWVAFASVLNAAVSWMNEMTIPSKLPRRLTAPSTRSRRSCRPRTPRRSR